MNDRRSDGELVAAHLGGDAGALGAMYDRHAPALYDTAAAMLNDRHEAADVVQDVFVTAAERLGQLRDPERLRPWLFAVLRNAVYRRTARRARSRPVDLSAPGAAEVAAPADPEAEGGRVVEAELAAAVRAAAAGLEPRDQLVLELSVRQGLSGADLADALGVTSDQSHVLVHRMRQRVERSLAAWTVARAGRRDCPELATLLQRWDGSFDVLVRKRVARHIDRCEVCERARRRFAVVPLLTSAPAFAIPVGLRDAVLRRAGSLGAGAGAAAMVDGGVGGPGRPGIPGPDGDRPQVDDVSGPDDFSGPDGFPRPVASMSGPPPSRPGRALLASVVAALVVALALVAVARWDGGQAEDLAARPASTGSSPPAPTSAEAASTGPSSPSQTASPSVSTTTTSMSMSTSTSTPTPAGEIVSPTITTAVPGGGPGGGTTTSPPAPGRLVVASSLLDLGAAAPAADVRLTNPGGLPVDFTIGPGPGSAAFSASPPGGTLGPGESLSVAFGVDRSSLAEGSHRRRFAIDAGDAGAVDVEVRASVERAPTVRLVRAPSATMSCPWSVPPLIAGEVADEATVGAVTVAWTGPGPAGQAPLTSPAPGQWRGQVAIGHVNGTWTWVVRATDARGNVGTASGATVVTGC